MVDRYVFVSTVSVYQGLPTVPLTEDSPVLDCPPDAGPGFGYDGDPGPSVYGFTKAGSERAVSETFGADRSVFLRPGVIVGPREYIGRLPWWLDRVVRGGRVLAPGRPGRVIQPVDVRDVADSALRAMADLLSACRQVTGSDAHFEWIRDESWLVAQGVAQWTELPLWRTYPGVWAVNSSRARDAGLNTRSLRSTTVDTWEWMHSGGPDSGQTRLPSETRHRCDGFTGTALADGTGRPLYRAVNKRGDLSNRPLSGWAVNELVKRYADRIGLDPARYGSHSLRAGFATEAAGHGATDRQIMRQGRWAQVSTVHGYIALANPLDDNAVTKLGL